VWKPAKIANLKVTGAPNRRRVLGPVDGNVIKVEADGVAQPKKLRYLYSAPWFGSLYGESGLPVGAFHIGD
jgi:hypothetical protein